MTCIYTPPVLTLQILDVSIEFIFSIISLLIVDRLIVLMESNCVLFGVRTEILHVKLINFSLRSLLLVA